MVEVTLSLPDKIYQHAARLSAVTQFEVSNILTEALAFTLPTLDEAMAATTPVSQLDNETVMAIADSQMPADKDERLSDLLYKQRENQLSVEEAAELLSLMVMYYSGWWQKTEALVEAVKRGLRPPLES
ncbi:MAG: hypothetical protein ONB44_13150 [candidate division KSB1 bacterium]|nr:hypothetical protein [candidate division KSB1 bacterium]MDZ7303068.1 hypothetical protein [candidate division KSB1 bacterium]MDZ7314394.1 hypothetical protein [candidate division KSB1 bacterium]